MNKTFLCVKHKAVKVLTFALNSFTESATLITGGRPFHRKWAWEAKALRPADFFLTFGSERRPAPEDRKGCEGL